MAGMLQSAMQGCPQAQRLSSGAAIDRLIRHCPAASSSTLIFPAPVGYDDIFRIDNIIVAVILRAAGARSWHRRLASPTPNNSEDKAADQYDRKKQQKRARCHDNKRQQHRNRQCRQKNQLPFRKLDDTDTREAERTSAKGIIRHQDMPRNNWRFTQYTKLDADCG
ncbi:hypothetical protein [Pseudochelatococcus contaminans]|uniref:Uncharacterized protein n=1 Tax=Pseudochelatococcus contaminans TaxID=1538103 RepID=A0A7W6EH65_9HYPH|nr:hypothetical protein [Pseudochelatococcus contaminans]MBB3809883.1 hypothetical protein [Pseudochelatococcus contaminans]